MSRSYPFVISKRTLSIINCLCPLLYHNIYTSALFPVIMPPIQSILKEVLAEIVPHDTVLKEAKAFVDDINSVAKKKKIKAIAVLGGSFAKDTYIVGDYDVDVFVRFHPSYEDDKLSELLF